ncbi:hypothetical protein TNCV_4721321 [Trichonephila clavipes]|uniref:Uncharacterized protein n=1 Tax=Trichonephila clavipes TaxID=2585209 RepID=A0A8X6W6E1_TRICX|nr:hypothetical protein TNCV_4721321 [Trichonephila clavipes]
MLLREISGNISILFIQRPRAWLLNHLTLPVPTDDAICRVFSESSALEQVVAILGIGPPWLSKTLRFLGHGSIFVNVCGDDALCSAEGQGNFRLTRLGSLLGFLVSALSLPWHPPCQV